VSKPMNPEDLYAAIDHVLHNCGEYLYTP